MNADRFVKERGNKKWSSIIIPEHKQMLYEMQNELYDMPKPVLTEEKMEEIQYIVAEAMATQVPVEINYYHNKRHLQTTGYVRRHDHLSNTLIVDSGERVERIQVADIIDCFLDK